jgi:hypothetical protein
LAEKAEEEQLKAAARARSEKLKAGEVQISNQPPPNQDNDNPITPGSIMDVYELEVLLFYHSYFYQIDNRVYSLYLQLKDGTFGSDRSQAVMLGEGAYARVLRGRNKISQTFVGIKEVNSCVVQVGNVHQLNLNININTNDRFERIA